MSSLRVHGFSLSLDGFGAGTDQSLEQPLGRGGEGLHQWMFPTRTFQSLYGKGEGTTGIDDRFAVRGFDTGGMMIAAEVVEGRALVALVEQFFANGEIAYLHAHFARRGCFAARIERA